MVIGGDPAIVDDFLRCGENLPFCCEVEWCFNCAEGVFSFYYFIYILLWVSDGYYSLFREGFFSEHELRT